MVYLDAFAGPGEYSTGELGSPVIAVQTALKHTAKLKAELWFVFYEPDERRCQYLQEVIARMEVPKHIKPRVRCGTFALAADRFFKWVQSSNERTPPTFAFIDPFGYSQIPMDLIARFAKLKRSEVLINFMYEEINRFLSKPDQKKHFDGLFGCREWRDVPDLKDPRERNELLHDLYMRQLRCYAGFRFVRSFEMINAGNHTDYYLFYGSNSAKGMEVMKNAMWWQDPERGCQFSDLDQSGQRKLFSEAPTPEDIARELHASLTGRTLSIEDLELFIADCHFRWAGIKKDVLPLLERKKLLNVERTGRGYVNGTILHFS